MFGDERGELDMDKEDCSPHMPCIAVTGDNVLERMDVSDAKVITSLNQFQILVQTTFS